MTLEKINRTGEFAVFHWTRKNQFGQVEEIITKGKHLDSSIPERDDPGWLPIHRRPTQSRPD